MNSQNFLTLAQACLRPPGEGVYTVSNAKDRKDELHQLLYGTTINIKEQWLKNINNELISDFNGVAALGICSDTGGGIQRGANWGPLFLRQAMHQNGAWDMLDLGDVFVVPQLLHDKYLNQETYQHIHQALYGVSNEQWPVSPLSIAELACAKFHHDYPQAKIFGMGGDHSVSYALVKAWGEAKGRKGKHLGLIHFDAHTDLMVERLGIDLCFGTWVPHIISYFQNPSDIYQIGIRSSGRDRHHWEETFGVHQLWSHEIKNNGLATSLERFERYLKDKNFDEVYISFDIDALDISYASATGTPESGGMAPHEAKMFLDIVGKHCKVTGADMVEIAPFVAIDHNPQGQWSTLQSASLLSHRLTELLWEK